MFLTGFEKMGRMGMSGQAFDKGSVVQFYPERFVATYTPMEADPIEYEGVGWGIVVVERNAWVATTKVMPMVLVEGQVVPLGSVTNAPGNFSCKLC